MRQRCRLEPLNILAKKGVFEVEVGSKTVALQLPNILAIKGDYLIPVFGDQRPRMGYDSGFHYPYFMGISPMDVSSNDGYHGDCRLFIVDDDGNHNNIDILVVDSYDDITSNPESPTNRFIVLRSLYSMIKRGDYDTVINTLIELRRHMGCSPIYAPATPPMLMPVLYALGVDLFDTAALKVSTITQKSVFVPFIGILNGVESKLSAMEETLSTMLTVASTFAEMNDLSYILEIIASADNAANILLRKFYAISERVWHWYPVALSKNFKIRCISPFALNRPDVKRWHHRIRTRYRPPPKYCLVLLPCSARKPYSYSNTHRKIKDIYRRVASKNDIGLEKFYRIFHEAIVTSPLGLVPRELERTYPAAHYDTPVAHIWDDNEVSTLATLLQSVLKNATYRYIVVYPSIVGIVRACFEMLDMGNTKFAPEIICPTGITGFENALSDIIGVNYNYYCPTELETAISIATYQFGPTIRMIFKECKIKGKIFNFSVFYNDRRVMTYAKERGMFALTLYGGNLLFEALGYNVPYVHIKDDFEIHGTILSPGIIDANKDIAKGDEVIVLRNSSPVAVGIALMSGSDMTHNNYGSAVKVREHL